MNTEDIMQYLLLILLLPSLAFGEECGANWKTVCASCIGQKVSPFLKSPKQYNSEADEYIKRSCKLEILTCAENLIKCGKTPQQAEAYMEGLYFGLVTHQIELELIGLQLFRQQ